MDSSGRVYIDSGERSGSGVIWEGARTTDQYANGDGTLYWTAGGTVYFLAHFAKSGGLIMENGHIRINVPADAMTVYFQDKCNAGMTATIRRDVDVAFYPTLRALFRRLMEEYKSACPQEWEKKDSFGIGIRYQGNENGANVSESLGMSVRRNGDISTNYENGFESARAQAIMNANGKLQEIAARNRAAQDRQREEQVQRTSDQKVQAFADKYGATGGWVKWGPLRSNPFALEGKVLLFNAEFVRMLTPTSGIFKDMAVSDIPRDAFTNSGKVVFSREGFRRKDQERAWR